MKIETAANKLAALLGLTEVKEEVEKKAEIRKGNTQAVPEEEIQELREAQGIIYFLQAPGLFQSRICKACGSHFIVSRLYVAFCSYQCIEADFKERFKVEWRKGEGIKDIESVVQDVYEGNEPIWVRSQNLDRLYSILTALRTSRDVTQASGIALSESVSQSLATMLGTSQGEPSESTQDSTESVTSNDVTESITTTEPEPNLTTSSSLTQLPQKNPATTLTRKSTRSFKIS